MHDTDELSKFVDRCNNIDYLKDIITTINTEIKSISEHKQFPSLTALAYASKLRISSDVAFERKLLPLYQQKQICEVRLHLLTSTLG